MKPEENLACSIFEQAIRDYRDLKNRNIECLDTDDDNMYSIKDIERFLKSKWCGRLLDMLGCEFTGNDILNRIESQYA